MARTIRIDTARSRKRLDHRIKTLDERNGIEFLMCLPELVTYGKLDLALHDREKATDFLMRAALMGSRVAIQKELGYLYLLDRPN